jgi:hypothetical protein
MGLETENQEIAIRGISVKNAGRDVQGNSFYFCAGRIPPYMERSSPLFTRMNFCQEFLSCRLPGLHYWQPSKSVSSLFIELHLQ